MQFKAPNRPYSLNLEIQADPFEAGWRRLTKLYIRTCRRLKAGRQHTPVAKKLFSRLVIKSGLQCGTSGRQDSERSWNKLGQDHTRYVRWLIRTLIKYTFQIRSSNSTFAMYLSSTTIHLLQAAGHHLKCSRWSSMALTNGMMTGSSTTSNATGSCIMSYAAWVTVTYGLDGNLRRISGLRRN